jgi:hypothetical protein
VPDELTGLRTGQIPHASPICFRCKRKKTQVRQDFGALIGQISDYSVGGGSKRDGFCSAARDFPRGWLTQRQRDVIDCLRNRTACSPQQFLRRNQVLAEDALQVFRLRSNNDQRRLSAESICWRLRGSRRQFDATETEKRIKPGGRDWAARMDCTSDKNRPTIAERLLAPQVV